MTTNMPHDYYNRHDPAKNYDTILYRDGYTLQGAELNEEQSASQHRLRGIADALFKDGDVIRDAQIILNSTTGVVEAESGVIYIAGAVRGVPSATFTIPVVGTVAVGVRLRNTVISELEDPTLYNPAIGSRGEGEPGAWRLRVDPGWGFDGDGGDGEFYPVYTVDDGILRPKEAPPTLDSFTQSLAKYDRDSTAGGSYIVSGFMLLQAPDAEGSQVYTVSAGRARVNGYGVEINTDRRLTYAAVPDIRVIDTEVHVATGGDNGTAIQRITVAHPPIARVTALRVTRRKSVSLIHGSYSGVADPLPDTAVVAIVECKQADTTYTQGTDYKKSGDKVDWSPAGAEPATGSTYTVTYDYICALDPQNLDADGFDVEGAVKDSSILVSYEQALPRIDRLCLTQEGVFQWLQGVASELHPRAPVVPVSLLALGTVYQTWRSGQRDVVTDGVRVVPFSEITAINNRIDYVVREVARQRLEADVFTRESGARVGLFVDPLLDDDMRDQGLTQTAAVVDGELVLALDGRADLLPADIAAPTALPYSPKVILSQPLRTGSMKVNPYMAFEPLPAQITLTPSVDFWTETQTRWTSPVTRIFSVGSGNTSSTSTSNSTQQVSSTRTQIEHLRQLEVKFEARGFGNGEHLNQVLFDGISVDFNG